MIKTYYVYDILSELIKYYIKVATKEITSFIHYRSK